MITDTNIHIYIPNITMFTCKSKEVQNSVVDSITRFVQTKDTQGSILSNARNASEENKKAIDKQLETFEQDIKSMQSGKMSYAEMRSRYG